MGMPEITFSTYPSLAGPSTQFSLPRKRAAWMMLTGNRITASVAVEWGLVNQCVPAGELLDAAEALAGRIASYDPTALAACKRALDTIPASITDWRLAFQYGELVNAGIRGRRGSHLPLSPKL